MTTIAVKNDLNDIENLKNIITTSLEDNKATDIEIIDLKGKTEIANYMIIATGSSDRQLKAIADHLMDKLKDVDREYIVEGLDQKDWVLVDAFDIIVHIFKEESRERFDLKSMWK